MASNDSTIAVSSSIEKRNRAACDACRARKVKCRYNEEETACQACLDLNVDCTRERPRKRRGPPSSYLEQEKRRKTRQDLLQNPPSDLPQDSQVIDDTITEQQLLPNDRPSLSSLAPQLVIRQIIDHWFELIHPLAPILHHDTFILQLNDSTKHDEDFICLVFSVCAATVATLRKKALDYATTVNVERCYYLVSDLDRGRGLSPATLIRCQIKYNFAVALGSEKGMDDLDSQMLLAEATAMIGRVVHYEMQNFATCERELTKRLYWLCFAAQCTLGLHSRPYLMPISAFTNDASLRLRDLNDKDLFHVISNDETWHGTARSYIPGLNALNDLFMLWYKSQQGDTSDLVHLHNYLEFVMCSLDNIPPELRWRGGLSRPPRSNFGTDVQMVNLHISQIHIRSFLLDQMASVAHHIQDTTEMAEISRSRQNLINDMLAIVYQMPEDTLAANGHSLINKLRDIGLSLFNHPNSEMSFVNLDRLLAKLDRLDLRRETAHMDGSSATPNSSASPVFSPLFDLDPGTLNQA